MQLYCNSFNEHFIIIFSMCFWPCFISEILDGIVMWFVTRIYIDNFNLVVTVNLLSLENWSWGLNVFFFFFENVLILDIRMFLYRLVGGLVVLNEYRQQNIKSLHQRELHYSSWWDYGPPVLSCPIIFTSFLLHLQIPPLLVLHFLW